ncbi:MAG: MFS transporter [Flavobacteriales bacterium]|nr:MFS transporter [Flavobacteriales bacterium]
MEKPKLSFWQIWNMSFGFLGIQMGFALQIGNTSRIFQTLSADVSDLPFYWLAGPITGLLIQPIIGYFSDRTWHPKLGRRRPYFLIGAIMATLALFVMPNSPTLWIAVGMLWIMDASFNVSMEPFRAFVGDVLPAEQRTAGFAMQGFFIGTGAVIASMLPWIFTNWLGISNTAPEGIIPDSVKWSFYIGAVAFLGAVLWTVLKAEEYPPENMEEFLAEKEASSGVLEVFKEIFGGIFKMPKTMIQLAVVQFFSWLALFAMWIYTTPAITEFIYGSTDTTTTAYNEGADWVNVCFAVYNGVAALIAFALPVLAKHTSRKITHMVALICGGIGMASMYFVTDPICLLISMVGVGIAWASILSMPYAILVGSLPEKKMGYFVGVFNLFIVFPQIVAAIILGYVLQQFFDNQTNFAFVIGGISMFIAAALCLIVDDKD